MESDRELARGNNFLKDNARDHVTTMFVRQTVPAYATSKSFRYLRKRYPPIHTAKQH